MKTSKIHHKTSYTDYMNITSIIRNVGIKEAKYENKKLNNKKYLIRLK